jgi:hypothetical protein
MARLRIAEAGEKEEEEKRPKKQDVRARQDIY